VTRVRNAALFLTLAAVWGSAFMAITAGLAYFPPVLFAAVRYDVAGVLMLAYAAYAVEDPFPRSRADLAVVAVGAVFLIAGYHALLFVAQADPAVTSAAAAVVVSLSPVLTTAFARALLPTDSLSVAGAVGLGLGLVGAVVLANPDPSDLLAGDVVAKLHVFGAALAFALGAVLTRRIDDDLGVESMEAWSMLGGAALLHLASLARGESLATVRLTPPALLSLAYLSVVASALGFLVYFDLLERLGPVQINLVSYVAPLFAALSGWAVLGETPTAATAVGFLCIFAGFACITREALRAELPRLRRALRGALR
jgi:drug/metabolite transporter (DMT)-like permease